MARHILTLNAGSSSLKFALFDAATLRSAAQGQIEGLGIAASMSVKDHAGVEIPCSGLLKAGAALDHKAALHLIPGFLKMHFPDAEIVAIGHRVVHGGARFEAPVIITDDITHALAALTPLAPLHQPHNLAGIAAGWIAFPDVPQIACFDTAFHRGHPFVEDTYALPRSFYDEGVRRYGFHGLSYEFIAEKLNEISPPLAEGKVIACHLGNGASICAIRNGRSLSSTMGFSPLDGLAMGTRSGQLDPAVILYLMDQKGMDASAISDLLYKQSGLKGLSGISSDMRILEASGDSRASEAIDYFTARIRREIGAMAAVLEGVDAIVFAGGIGENGADIRARVLNGLGWLGVEMSTASNKNGDAIISTANSKVTALVIRTNEELMIAQHTARLIAAKQ